MDRKKPLPPPSPSDSESPSESESDDDDNTSPPGSQPKPLTPSQPADSSEYTDVDDSEDASGSSDESEDESDSSPSDSQDGPKPVTPLVAQNRANGIAKKGAVVTPPPEQKAKKGKMEGVKREREGVSEDPPALTKRKKDGSESVSTGERLYAASKEVSHSEKAGKEKQGSLQRDKEKVAQVQSHDAEKPKEQPKKGSKQKSEEKPPVQIPVKGNRMENGSEKKGPKTENEGKSDKKAQKNSESDVATEKLPASPVKPRKTSLVHWTPKEEITFSSKLLSSLKSGAEIPNKKDGFWTTLHEELHGELEGEWSKEQLFDKAKRMKTRYGTMAEKIKESDKPFKHRNDTDLVLFGLWSKLWGNEKEVHDDKEEQSKPVAGAVTNKEGKSTQDRKEPDAHKAKQSKQDTDETEDLDSDESDDEGGSQNILDSKDMPKPGVEVYGDGNHKSLLDMVLQPRVTGTHHQAEDKSPHSSSLVHKILQDATRTSLQEAQEISKRMLDEWQSKAMAVVESAVKAVADKSRLTHGMGLAGMGGFGLPSINNWEHLDFQFSNGEHAFQQQWYELHLQELDLYSQRLQLMQKECRLKQEQLKLQLEKGK